MTRSQLLAALVPIVIGACAHPAPQPRTVGPVLGESTATGPADPSAPPPAPGGVTEVSRPLHGTPSPVANPAITVDTMPSTTGSNATAPSTTVFSGAGTGPAPVGAAPGASPSTAGPNGPGTGNATTPTGAATGGASPGATNTAPPAAPPPTPGNGPGTGNTVNRPAPVPAQPIPPAAPSTPTVPQR